MVLLSLDVLMMRRSPRSALHESALCRLPLLATVGCLALFLTAPGCKVERRRSDAELGLTPTQANGRQIYDQYCDRCHAPYSSRGRQGPSLKGIFKKPYLGMSGIPANDDRVRDIVMLGRNKMDGFGNILTPEQVNDLLTYLHTL
jgi:mono/diheme cytochrome c family protein